MTKHSIIMPWHHGMGEVCEWLDSCDIDYNCMSKDRETMEYFFTNESDLMLFTVRFGHRSCAAVWM